MVLMYFFATWLVGVRETVDLPWRQELSRVYRFAVLPDFEMQARLASRSVTHRRNALALSDGFALLYQQRRVVPVSTEVGVVVLHDNKLSVTD